MVDKAHVYIVDSVSMTAIAKPSRSQSYPQPKRRQDINLHALNETSRFFLLTENPSSHRPTRPNHEQVSALGVVKQSSRTPRPRKGRSLEVHAPFIPITRLSFHRLSFPVSPGCPGVPFSSFATSFTSDSSPVLSSPLPPPPGLHILPTSIFLIFQLHFSLSFSLLRGSSSLMSRAPLAFSLNASDMRPILCPRRSFIHPCGYLSKRRECYTQHHGAD